MSERKFDDARQFDVGDDVQFKYDEPIVGDGEVHVGTVSAVTYHEDDQQIRHNFRYTVNFRDPRDKDREVKATHEDGTEETQIIKAEDRQIMFTGAELVLAP